MLGAIKRMIRLIVRYAVTSNSSNDSGQFQIQQHSYFDEPKDLVVVYPYGYSASAPIDNLSIMINVGDKERAVAFPISGDSRHKNLKPGESVMSNPLTKSFIKFNADKSIELESAGDLSIKATSTNSTTVWTNDGDVTINGNLQVNGDIASTGSLDVGTTITSGATITSGSNIISATAISAGGPLSGSTISAGGISGSGGTLTASTDVTAGGISLITHTHTGVTSGGSNTGGPV